MKIIDKTKKNTASFYLLHSTHLPDLGILQGKMGLILFYYELSKNNENKIYEEYASELLDDVYEDLSLDTPIAFDVGLCGIGWAFLYLWKNGFVEGNLDEMLTDIDQIVMKYSPKRFSDYSLEKGLEGIASYVYGRESLCVEQNVKLFEIDFLDELEFACMQANLPKKTDYSIENTWEKVITKYRLTSSEKGYCWKREIVTLISRYEDKNKHYCSCL